MRERPRRKKNGERHYSSKSMSDIQFQRERVFADSPSSYALDHDEGSDGVVEYEEHDGNDDILRRKETSIVDSALPVDQSKLERNPPYSLIHHADSSDSLDNICPGERRGSSSSHQLRSRDESRSTDHPPRSSFGSVNSDGVDRDNLLDPNHKLKLGIGCTVTKPPIHVFDEEEEDTSSEMERRWMREYYEKEGWLPGPRPSKTTLENRKRTM